MYIIWTVSQVTMFCCLASTQRNNEDVTNDPMNEIMPMSDNFMATGDRYLIHREHELETYTGSSEQYTSTTRIHEMLSPVSATEKPNTKDKAKAEETIESCSYTFVIPNESGQRTSICSKCKTTAQQLKSEEQLVKMHREVMNAKNDVEETRKEISEGVRQFPAAAFRHMKENIKLLERGSRNTDERLNQLYTHLLHELISKRDSSLEVQVLANQVLNQTVAYYQLKIQHEQLLIAHNALQMKVNNQSEELKRLHREINTFITNQRVTSKEHSTAPPPLTRTNSSCTKEQVTANPANTSLPQGPFTNCNEVQQAGYNSSDVFTLKLVGFHRKIKVWCDLEKDPGGWTVIQRRGDRTINFSRSMVAFKKGFGNVRGDYWIGLENLHRMTNQTDFKLHIEMEDWEGRKRFAEYRSFRVGSEETGYKLRITHYGGNAGDSLTWHNNMRFTTYDVDNDLAGGNCARSHGGGWWYRDCARANLNGVYHRRYYFNHNQDGIYWASWKGATYSLRKVVMKVRPIE